jgi:cytochrome c553
VWSVVAALLKVRDMDGKAYRAAIGSDTTRGPEEQRESTRTFVVTGPAGGSLVACARCHGIDGQGGGAGSFPRLAGQSEAYLLQSLNDYASGSRQSGIMGPIAAAMDQEDRARLAAYYGRAKPAAAEAVNAQDRAHTVGSQLAAAGDPARSIAACAPCHATTAANMPAVTPLYPRLAGQEAWYLRQQLTLWRNGHRGGSPLSDIMAAAARNLTETDIAVLADYYAALPAAAP